VFVSKFPKGKGFACPRCKALMDEVVTIEPLANEAGLIGYECSAVPLRDKRAFAAFDSQPLKENPTTKMSKRGGVPGPCGRKKLGPLLTILYRGYRGYTAKLIFGAGRLRHVRVFRPPCQLQLSVCQLGIGRAVSSPPASPREGLSAW
jgi:hypothetical protein